MVKSLLGDTGQLEVEEMLEDGTYLIIKKQKPIRGSAINLVLERNQGHVPFIEIKPRSC